MYLLHCLPGAANALSGLMSHYAQDSGSDSESDNEASPALATSVDSVGGNLCLYLFFYVPTIV